MADNTYSTLKISQELIEEIIEAIHDINYGSIEIYVQDNLVTQITVRKIKKTNVTLNGKSKKFNGKYKNINTNYTLKQAIDN